MGNLSRFKRVKVIYAFPGHGKTPFAQWNPGPWLDLDFGFIRTAFRVEKSREKVLYKPYARLVSLFVDEGYTIFSNAPETIPYIKSFLKKNQIMMVLPKSLSHPAKKLGVSEDTVAEWIQGWADAAVRNDIPVYWTEHSFGSFMNGRE